MHVSKASSSDVRKLWQTVEAKIEQASAVEAAAQQLASACYEQFADSVVLARVFMTVPFGDLPAANKEFVRKLVDSAGAGSALDDTTPVLSLVGTHGREANWNDRRNSEGHIGIPLVSSAFVGAIPMISRLLKEFGVPLDWIDTRDAAKIARSIGRSVGLFFVDDASTATDAEGRKIIAAQDFVSKYGVKSVFGAGGAYANGQLAVIVVFCDEPVDRSTAETFLDMASLFKSKTAGLVEAGRTFA
jgi:hypothetical protein